ncbi:MAG TPA: tRNA pseudouridine(55) synthase TruB [Candidatus Eremiobacteraceae bacterium]|nr:tRNA pseudouridine(55) synthase TruB [Candidatus Eremiobacteraceae bacterium]
MTRDRVPFGFVNAFKPPGISSTAFGVWVRKRLGAGSLGHWGTLDPSACGVLVLAIGQATRLIPYLPADDKSYVFELRVGTATDTGDAEGRVTRSAAVPHDWADRLLDVATSLVADIEQVPPMYSAVKIDGRPLYKAARAGREVERRARTVRISALRVLDSRDDRARMAVDCSAGTYVRTLCEQIGERLGLPAHLAFLIRTRAGPFALADAVTPAQIARDRVACAVDPLEVLELPRAALDDASAARFSHGNDVASTLTAGIESRGGFVLATHRGEIIGVARAQDSRLEPVRVIAAAGENS